MLIWIDLPTKLENKIKSQEPSEIKCQYLKEKRG